jgi:hypothetical protein
MLKTLYPTIALLINATGLWAKVIFFFVAIIVGNLVYFVLGVICAIVLSPDAVTRTANAHAVGINGWRPLGATVAAAIGGLVSSIPDRIWPPDQKGPDA